MIKKFVGGISFLTLFFCGSIFSGQQPSMAELRAIIDEQVRAEKAQIEERVMDRQYKVYGDMSTSFALASVMGFLAADAIIKMVNGGINSRDMAAAIVGSGASLWTLLNVINGARRLAKLAADKEAMLEKLEEQKKEVTREMVKMERRARAEAEKKQQIEQKTDTTEAEDTQPVDGSDAKS